MTTPEVILLTQIPIAAGCFWLAWELRKLRQSFERNLGPDERAPEGRSSDGGSGRGPGGPGAGEERP
jgi:hypothetical protein